MRTSLAIACLAGVALASKSKNYRNKHTAAENPVDRCLNYEAYMYRSATPCDDIWRAWDEQCKHEWWRADECSQVQDTFWGVEAPAPPVACDDCWDYVCTNQVCIDAWIAYDTWCGWWAMPADQFQVCQQVGIAACYGLPRAMVVTRKTQMQEKHSLQQRKRAAGKRQQTVVEPERETAPAGDETEPEPVTVPAGDETAPAGDETAPAGDSDAVRPTGDCLDWQAYMYKSGTACDDVWRAWDTSCWNDHTEECDQAEKDMEEIEGQFVEPGPQVVEFAPVPACSFMTRDGDQECSDAWAAMMLWCWAGDKTEAQEEDCQAGFLTMYPIDSLIEEPVDGAAVMRKTTMQRKHELKKSAAGKHALKKTAAKKRSGKKASVNLAAFSSAANDSQYASGVAMGAAVGAAAALGALYAISKCNKGRVDDFQRV